MRKYFLLLSISLMIFFCNAQNYSRVKINADAEGLNRLANLGVAVDHGTYKRNTFLISDFSANEIKVMKENGFDYEILIEDVQQYYLDQNLLTKESTQKNAACSGTGTSNTTFTPATPSNFNLGTMGGYLKYNEMLAELDAMALQFPNLITSKTPISTFLTRENRPIYHVKISDNPSNDEVDEPNVLYTAIHHAREPMSLMETIFYMWYLLENYNSSDEVKYLVDNTQMYFVPCINPDGYLYNELTDPFGGGMWRKNRRDNGDGTYGVDLNRNYSYGWGTTGTSFNTDDETYCGTSVFSEPETQAIRWLVQNHKFSTAFNAHTYAEDILFPIGTTTAEFAPRHNWFQDESNHMVRYNGYTAMKSSGLYAASGDSDDYMYKVDIGQGVKDTIMAHTPEVGTAFWQPASEIVETCKEMVFPNLVLAHLPGKYLLVDDTDPSIISTLSGNFNHAVQRLGLKDGPVTVSIEPLLNIATVGSPVVYDIACRATETGAIAYTLNPSIQFGDEIKYVLKTYNGLWVKKDTIIKTYGSLTLHALEDGSTTNWTGNWGTSSTVYLSASQSYTESPSGPYANGANKTFTYVPIIDLTNATAAMISYYAKWDIEADYDYCQFQVSTDEGATWIGQCTNYTVPGNNANGSVQPNGLPVYEGTQSSWVLDEVNLSDYLGQSIKVRFVFKSDNWYTLDGFYFDDFKVMYNVPGQASAPVASFSTSTPTVCLGNNVGFNDFSTNNPTSWSWDFGDGTTSTNQTPTHTYLNPGTYTVTLTVTNSTGSDTQVIANYITVNALPTVSLLSSDADNVVCVYSGIIDLIPTPSGSSLSGVAVTGSSFDPGTAGVGNYTLTATHVDGNGCQQSAQLTMSVESCAGIESIISDDVLIQPNPNNGSFKISGLDINSALDVYDINGKLVYHVLTVSEELEVKLSDVKCGMYYLQATSKNEMRRFRISVL